jgi:hypothetical protein
MCYAAVPPFILSNISFVHSTGKEKEIIAMEQGGNEMVNQIFEAKMRKDYSSRLSPKAGMNERKDFIRKKYVDRKYYTAAEYLMALKRINNMGEASKQTFSLKQSARDTTKGNPRSKGGSSGTTDPFSRNNPIVSQVAVAKEAISDADFFKSMNQNDDWLDPFEGSRTLGEGKPGTKVAPKRRAPKKEDGLSHSWHAQSPKKVNTLKPVLGTNKFEETLQARRLAPHRSSSFMVGKGRPNHQHYLDEDDTVFDSVFTPTTSTMVSKANTTPKTVTSTSRRRGRKSSDPLSTSCHASISASHRSAPNDLSKSLHGTTTGASLFADRAQSQSSNKARPRLMRRMSATALGSMEMQATESKAPASNLVVEALLDFVKNNPDVSVDALTAALTPADNGIARTPRPRRPQQSSSSKANERERSKSATRSSSRSRTNSRSRRAALIKRMSKDNLVDDDNGEVGSRPSAKTTRRSQERRLRHQSSSDNRNDGGNPPKTSSSNEAEEVERTMPFGDSRRKSNSRSRERRARSRSGSLGGSQSGRRRKNGSSHGSVPRRNGGGSDRATSTSGRARRQLKRSNGSQDAALETGDSNEIGAQKCEIDAFPDFEAQDKAMQPDSPTVSEASDILDDDDDLLIT